MRLRLLTCLNRHVGDGFKWLFYGDDDTVFFVEPAMNVVRTLDPDLPYFLTGAVSIFQPAWFVSNCRQPC